MLLHGWRSFRSPSKASSIIALHDGISGLLWGDGELTPHNSMAWHTFNKFNCMHDWKWGFNLLGLINSFFQDFRDYMWREEHDFKQTVLTSSSQEFFSSEQKFMNISQVNLVLYGANWFTSQMVDHSVSSIRIPSLRCLVFFMFMAQLSIINRWKEDHLYSFKLFPTLDRMHEWWESSSGAIALIR